jgi:hypothetical protein
MLLFRFETFAFCSVSVIGMKVQHYKRLPSKKIKIKMFQIRIYMLLETPSASQTQISNKFIKEFIIAAEVHHRSSGQNLKLQEGGWPPEGTAIHRETASGFKFE